MINKIDTPLMFNRIAYRYDMLNHVLSMGADKLWRREFVKRIPNGKYDTIVDIATGTGSLLLEMQKLNANYYIGIDPAQKMINIAKEKVPEAMFISASAEKLPLDDECADLVSIAFGIRNFDNPVKALKEIHRILKDNAMFAILEFAVPKQRVFAKPYRFYFDNIMPFLGEKISGDHYAYSYLKESVKDFDLSFNICDEISRAGFQIIKHSKIFVGSVELCFAKKKK